MEDLLIWVGLAVLAVATFLHFFSKGKPTATVVDTKSQQQQSELDKLKAQVVKKESDISYGKIFLFFGSQSGTANKFSVILSQEAAANDFDGSVEDLKDFKPEFFTHGNNLCVFCMATQGEGEPTDNAIGFYSWLKDQTDETLLKNTRFTVFGLGNTQYEHYNLMGRETNKHFERLGAKRIYRYGEGDDNSSLEDDFNQWKTDLWTEIKKVVPQISLKESGKLVKKRANAFCLRKTEKAEVELVNDGKTKYEFMTQTYLNGSVAMIKSIKEIRQNNADGSTLHVEINLKNTPLKYKTAQNLGVFAENDPTLVDRLAAYLKVDLNERVEVDVDPEQAEKFKHPFPSPISVRSILAKFCDFQGQVMKKTLKDIAKLTEREDFKLRLEKLASATGKKEFEKDILGKQRTLFDLLKEYEIVPTLEQFIELCPRLSPRLFTISSSDAANAEVVTITDSLVADVLEDGSVKHGICSKFLINAHNKVKSGISGNRIRIDFRNSSFVLPQSAKTPVIMVGPGTGVAPFIAFCQEKQALLEKGINIAPGEFTLYFGCRHREGDFIFREELQSFVDKKVLNKLYTAFSRDQGSKVYVQDLLKQNGDEFYEQFIERNGVLYICGATSMGNSVVQAVVDIVQKKQGISAEEAHKLVEQMEKNKRIIKELW